MTVDLVCYSFFLMFFDLSKLSSSKRGAFQTGLAAAFRRPDLILQGDHRLSRETTSNSPSNEDLQVYLLNEVLLRNNGL